MLRPLWLPVWEHWELTFSLIEILLLMNKCENLGACWPQGFSPETLSPVPDNDIFGQNLSWDASF